MQQNGFCLMLAAAAHTAPTPAFAGSQVQAVRVSAAGWGLAILAGLGPLLEAHPVQTVQLEWSPEGGEPQGEDGAPPLGALLRELAGLGFVEVTHSGPLCSARWASNRKDVLYLPRDGGEADRVDSAAAEAAPCRLTSEDYDKLEGRALRGGRVEVIVLRRQT